MASNPFGAPWWSTGQSVWCTTSFGELRIADCRSKTLALRSQCLNARLIAAAPEMVELLEDIYLTAEPDHQVRISALLKQVLEG
jgi:hypothetical protein